MAGHTESDFAVSAELPDGPAGAGGPTADVTADSAVDAAADELVAKTLGTDPVDLDLDGPQDSTVGTADPDEAQPATDEDPRLDLRIKTTSGDIRLRRAALI